LLLYPSAVESPPLALLPPVGLGHVVASGPGGHVAAGEVKLPYKGLGGWGYERTGTSLTIHDKTNTGDLMSYSVDRWLSPFSWNGMYNGILAEAPHVNPHPARSARAHTAETRSRRLVAGVLVGGTGQIIASIVADAASPAANGPVAGKLLALDAKGHAIAAVAIHGTPVDEAPGGHHPSLPFVVALPAQLNIAALVLRNNKGKTVAKLRRSKRAPAARFARLPRKTKANAKLTVRWTTADPDSRTLTVLLYARSGNSAWRLVAATTSGKKSASAQLFSLGHGKSLRLRLVVSDGLNTTTTYSKAIKLR
jgi:hypothetical protein